MANTEQLESAAAPIVPYVVPGQAAQNTDWLTVQVYGQETNFDASSVVSFGTGITVADPQVTSPTLMSVRVAIAATAPTGPHSVSVTTGAEFANGLFVFSVTAAPVILSVVPDTVGRPSFPARLQFNGSGSHFEPASTLAFSGLGITVITATIVAVSQTRLEADVNIAATATLGLRSFTITSQLGNGREIITNQTLFRVADMARILSITPDSGAQASNFTVQLVGQYTNFTSASRLSFSNSRITGSNEGMMSATSLFARATIGPAAARGPCDVIVTTGSEVATGIGLFTVVLSSDKAVILREGVNTYLCQNHISDPATVDICEEFVESVHQALRQQVVLKTATGVTVTVETTAAPSLQEAVTLREATNTYLRQNHIADPVAVDVCEEFIEAVNQALRDDLAGAGSGVMVTVGVET